MRIKRYLLLIIAIALSCKKPYNPTIVSIASGYLVVEGTINSGSGPTYIKLSRTVSIQSQISLQPELNAILYIQSDQNDSYPLGEAGNGVYTCGGLNLSASHKYRLSIKTADAKQYLSDYAEILNAPPIDSVSYDFNGTVFSPGININVNTHDPNDKVLYYRWDYQETWEIQSAFKSLYKSNGDTVLQRDLVNDDIHSCWLNDTSSTIIIGSSAKLKQHIISNNPIIAIRSDAEKIGVEYSVIVTQYALTSDAYNLYTNVKKNTEQLGSIFDAEPSQISGNIHSVTNPSEPVVGYVSVGSPSTQRIFVKKAQLPNGWTFIPFYSGCKLFTDEHNLAPCCYYSYQIPINTDLFINQVNLYINYDARSYSGTQAIPVDAIKPPGGPIIGYTAAIQACTDCTLRGTNVPPAFWK
jgi:hypothetical protein